MSSQFSPEHDNTVRRAIELEAKLEEQRTALRRRRLRRRVAVSLLIIFCGTVASYAAFDMYRKESHWADQLQGEFERLRQHQVTVDSFKTTLQSLTRAVLAQAGMVRETDATSLSAQWWLARTRIARLKEDFPDPGFGQELELLEIKLSDIYDLGMKAPESVGSDAKLNELQERLRKDNPVVLRLVESLTEKLEQRSANAEAALIEHRRLRLEARSNIWVNAGVTIVILLAYLVFSRRFERNEQLETELRSTQANLDLALRDLQGSEEELLERERKRLLGEVAESFAHELRNVLMPITAMSELMLEEGGLSEKQRRWTEVARICCTDAAVVLSNMNQFLSVIGHPSKHEDIELCAMLQQVVEFTRP
ncbi:MAG: hypothetical protein R3B96_15080, partial [Pirellulaceae bacterium]